MTTYCLDAPGVLIRASILLLNALIANVVNVALRTARLPQGALAPGGDSGDDRGMCARAPGEGIRRHGQVIERLSDDELVERLENLTPLPDADDDDPAWFDDATWDRAEFLLAVADAIGERGLLAAIGPLFQRAALGDGYEMMQGLRHGPERAVAGDWAALATIMRPLTRDQRSGCRRWAVRELGILRDPRAFDDLAAALANPQPLVRREACMSLRMLSQDAGPAIRQQIRAQLLPIAGHDPDSNVRALAQQALNDITEHC